MMTWLAMILYLVVAPFAGGLLMGLDRKASARIQRRIGPPVLQPFYDVLKLWEKEDLVVNPNQHFFLIGYLIFTILAGAIFFAGGDLLIVIFALTLGSILLILGAYSAHSPYSHIGAERELLQIMAAEPMLLIAACGLYLGSKSFQVDDIAAHPHPLIVVLPGVFLGLLFVLTIKFRKSPFDLSTSHHAHQELVKGLTTEFSGPSLAIIEVAHWYENIMLLGMVYLFFAPYPAFAVVATLFVYLLEVIVDNATARLKWQHAMTSSWLVAATLGAINILILHVLQRGGI